MRSKVEKMDRFGKWVVIDPNRGKPLCKCVCGTVKEVDLYSLLNGRSKSCGCVKNVKHGGVSDPLIIPTYTTWEGIKQRCLNPNNSRYHNYGGRGITVCDRWMVFENFLEDMGIRPKGTSIDRINNDLGYFPGNCRWATPEEQNLNTRVNHRITFNGESLTIKEWSTKLGIPYTTISKRITSGFPLVDVLSVTKLDNRHEEFSNRKIAYRGVIKTLKEWVEELGLNYNTVKSRLMRGTTNPTQLFSQESAKPGSKPGSKKPEGSGRSMSVSEGDTFGKLTVKSLFREASGNQMVTKAICVCECGTEKIYNLSNLKSGKTVTCGCSKKQAHNKGVYSVVVGQRFGRFVITDLFSENNTSFALCQCDCGNIKRVAVNNLKRGNTVSCGCGNRERMKNNNPGKKKLQAE